MQPLAPYLSLRSASANSRPPLFHHSKEIPPDSILTLVNFSCSLNQQSSGSSGASVLSVPVPTASSKTKTATHSRTPSQALSFNPHEPKNQT